MSTPLATLHYIHDPLCGWCYGAQPLVSAAVAMLGDRLALRLHGGALFAEPQELTPSMAEHIVRADERIEQISGQPFGDAYTEGLLAEQSTVLYSLPPIAAILAAESLHPEAAYPMLAAIQNAHYQRGLRVVEHDVLTELAEEIGLPGTRFAEALESALAHDVIEHVQASRRLLGDVGGQGFPTLVLEIGGAMQLLTHHQDFGRPDAFVERIAARLPAVH
ncbi:DsbA family protein [Dyella sp. BiH032]|uniref:DsbA family protein n=1 Tax=Dyella sp. BiH032 TaxID=3075430 RepID=UPI00289321B8|nr:DsbA family protein [Dyella sp. BiH032]WNL44579.1 DsbA family protein [Dyella sp. BiH032]